MLEVGFDLLGALLALCEFLVALVDLTLVLAFELDELLLGLEYLLLLYHFAVRRSLLDDRPRTGPHAVKGRQTTREGACNGSNNHYYGIHIVKIFIY